MSFDGSKTAVKDLFEQFGGPTPDWVHDSTPKQMENWHEHGSQIVADMDSDRARWWYLRTYRPKKRGDGMMERNHVSIGEPEHYYKKYVDGLKRPMGSIQGEVMAAMFVSDDVQDDVEEAAAELVRVTTSDAEKKRIAQQGERLAGLMGL